MSENAAGDAADLRTTLPRHGRACDWAVSSRGFYVVFEALRVERRGIEFTTFYHCRWVKVKNVRLHGPAIVVLFLWKLQ